MVWASHFRYCNWNFFSKWAQLWNNQVQSPAFHNCWNSCNWPWPISPACPGPSVVSSLADQHSHQTWCHLQLPEGALHPRDQTISSMKILNRTGPSVEPWGTPLVTGSCLRLLRQAGRLSPAHRLQEKLQLCGNQWSLAIGLKELAAKSLLG